LVETLREEREVAWCETRNSLPCGNLSMDNKKRVICHYFSTSFSHACNARESFRCNFFGNDNE